MKSSYSRDNERTRFLDPDIDENNRRVGKVSLSIVWPGDTRFICSSS